MARLRPRPAPAPSSNPARSPLFEQAHRLLDELRDGVRPASDNPPQHLNLLGQISELLLTTGDYPEALKAMTAALAGPLADLCVLDLVDGAAARRLAAAAPSNPGRAKELRGLQPSPTLQHAYRRALALRRPLRLRRRGTDPLAGQAHAMLLIPILGGERPVGVLLCALIAPGRRFSSADLALAAQIARLAGAAAERASPTKIAVAVSAAAHELRGQLTAIGLTAAALLRGAPDPDGLERIRRVALDASPLVEDLLRAGEAGAGHLDVHCTPVLPGELVAEALDRLAPSAGDHPLEARIAGDLPPLRADRQRMLQVLTNLVGNALKFSPPAAEVTVAAQWAPQGVCLTVTDHGPGLSEEQRARVFEPFWQGEAGDHRGAGLGLHVARRIVDAHGGRIWVERAADGGCAFRLLMPALERRTQPREH